MRTSAACATLICALTFSLGATNLTPSPAGAGNRGPCSATIYGIGYRLIPFKDQRKAAIWYPSSSAQRTFAYSKDISTTLADNGTPLTGCGKFPLVVFAHGLLGCGAQSIFFTEELARHGYVVVAPDYRDALLCRLEDPVAQTKMIKEPSIFRPQDWTPLTYVDRMIDTKYLITMILRDPTFGPAIDVARIGIAGHSLGGYTAQGVVGGWPTWRDSRIKAALLMSPYSLPFSVRGTLGGVTVPLMYQGAQGDVGITPFLSGANGAYAHSNAPKYFGVLFGGNHFTWTNAICAGAGTTAKCLSSSKTAALIDAYGIAFFDKHLKGLNEPLLTSRGSGFAAYTFKE